MTTVEQIENAIRNLPPGELASLRTWFAQFDSAAWDEQISRDMANGKLDALADNALEHLRAGRCTDL
jgi:hypothetical protein